jgi:hypothetical protein
MYLRPSYPVGDAVTVVMAPAQIGDGRRWTVRFEPAFGLPIPPSLLPLADQVIE